MSTETTATPESALGAGPATDAGAAPPPVETQPQADVTPGATAGEAAQDAPLETAPPAPETPEYEQFSFRVDGTRFEHEGVVRDRQGRIIIPHEVWEREIQPKYLGHRPSWQRDREHYERQLRALQDDNRPEILRANAFSDRILQILDLDPVERDEQLERFRAEVPVLEAKMEAEAARRQADALRGAVDQQRQQELSAEVIPILQDELGSYIQAALGHEKLKGLDLDPKELQQALWEEFGPQGLFFDADQENQPHFDTPAGGVRFHTERIDRFLLREGGLVRRQQERSRAEMERLQAQIKAAHEAADMAKRNAAALAPDKPTTPVVPSTGGVQAPAEQVKPWHDPNKTPEERRALYLEHARAQGYLI